MNQLPRLSVCLPPFQGWLLTQSVELRTRWLRLPYGDQGLLVARTTLKQVWETDLGVLEGSHL